MTREEIIEGLKLLEDNMVYFDELLNDKGEYIDVHELLFETIEVLEQEPMLDKIRAEIADLEIGISRYHHYRPWIFRDEALEIIDKYKAESDE